MALIVQKYGGTSVADAERIKNVAVRITEARDKGNQVVVVVSATGDTTDVLVKLAYQVSPQPDRRELDVLLSTGEIVSSTLLAMVLHDMGYQAISLSGAQAGIRTDATYSRARILKVESRRVVKELEKGNIVIVAGFQGVTEGMDITTLVMHPRAVELGELYNVPILVASSFTRNPGTLIHREVSMEVRNKVRSIAHNLDVAKITVIGIPDHPGIAAAIFQPLAKAGISVDTIVQNASINNITDLTFTVTKGDLARAMEVIKPIAASIGAKECISDSKLGEVSIIGTGMQNTPGFAARMFAALSEKGINIQLITTSEIRITCIIDKDSVKDAVRILHQVFELEVTES